LRCVRERWSTRATGRSVTGGSPGTLRARRVAGGVGHFAICLSSPIQIEAYAYLYIACLPSRHPCNQQPFLRETCSPLHAIPIIVLLAPRLDPILAPLSVSLGQVDERASVQSNCLHLSAVLCQSPGQWVGVRAVHPLKRSRICLLVNRKAVVFRSQLLCVVC
jgi:hypothetical protein